MCLSHKEELKDALFEELQWKRHTSGIAGEEASGFTDIELL